jgi:hypothetical protein
MRKVLEINQENERKLIAVVDAALKSQGIQMLETVHTLIMAIHDEPDLKQEPVPMEAAKPELLKPQNGKR